MTCERGCFNCVFVKRLNRKFYKCTEPRSFPNLDNSDKVTGKIKDLTILVYGVYLGYSCNCWVKGNGNKEIVEFT